jgi:hypothetical protein
MKRKYALAAALVGVLVLPLCSCAGGIEGKARQYLSGRYSGEFIITDTERITNETGPIPVLIPSYHWKLTAKSEHFPGETFFFTERTRTKNGIGLIIIILSCSGTR